MSSSGWEGGGEGPQNIFYVDCLGLGLLSKPFLFEEAKAWHKWPMEQFRCFFFFCVLCLLVLIQRMVISCC
jgi:hypothetical protein